MTEQLLIRTDGALGRITLNRPEAINALSLPMIEGITAALREWRENPAIGAVLFEGAGPRGFCSGGDVRAARALVVEGRAEAADHYFATEYAMNGLIAGYPKPLAALSHGVTMGGGIGIAGHCRVRLTQPGARFAMPESAIGFFGDVGVNAILARAPLNRALLFLMSGASVGAADAVALGLADVMVPRERVDSIRADLAVAATAPRPETAIVALAEAEAVDGGDTPFVELADLLPPGEPESPAAFVARVEGVPALAEIAALLSTRSPTSLTATFHAQLAARRVMDVGKVLEADLRLAAVMARCADFAEGVRAVLVDKDQKPSWSPGTLGEVDAAAFVEAVGS